MGEEQIGQSRPMGHRLKSPSIEAEPHEPLQPLLESEQRRGEGQGQQVGGRPAPASDHGDPAQGNQQRRRGKTGGA